jgi:hypothetical protein
MAAVWHSMQPVTSRNGDLGIYLKQARIEQGCRASLKLCWPFLVLLSYNGRSGQYLFFERLFSPVNCFFFFLKYLDKLGLSCAKLSSSWGELILLYLFLFSVAFPVLISEVVVN